MSLPVQHLSRGEIFLRVSESLMCKGKRRDFGARANQQPSSIQQRWVERRHKDMNKATQNAALLGASDSRVKVRVGRSYLKAVVAR